LGRAEKLGSSAPGARCPREDVLVRVDVGELPPA